jgi:hypothetical protein
VHLDRKRATIRLQEKERRMLKSLRKMKFYRRQFSAWQKKYDAQAPKAGDLAPEFELWDVDGQRSVRLSDFRDKKPVALVFGSFT